MPSQAVYHSIRIHTKKFRPNLCHCDTCQNYRCEIEGFKHFPAFSYIGQQNGYESAYEKLSYNINSHKNQIIRKHVREILQADKPHSGNPIPGV